MENRRFDDLARGLATATSRRRLLRGLAAALVGGAGGVAARSARPADIDAQPVSCTTFCLTALPPGLPQLRRILQGLQGAGVCVECGPASDGSQTLCGTTCVDPSSDSDHCGGCGIGCDANQACCAGICTDLTTLENCGACGNVCTDLPCHQTICQDGSCANIPDPLVNHTDCPGGSCCNGACVDMQSDDANCGGCTLNCGEGETCCSGQCFDTRSTHFHCGGCDINCPPGLFCAEGHCCLSLHSLGCTADADCCAGICHSTEFGGECCFLLGSACTESFECCDSNSCCNGMCVDHRVDEAHCGGCGIQCDAAASQICQFSDCCGAAGAACADDGGCCNGEFCLHGACCTHIGGPCADDSECCHRNCDAGVCACPPLGGFCPGAPFVQGGCCVGICDDGTCRCDPPGATCSNSGQCCSGFCTDEGQCE